jgi:hypothetical protein
LVFTDRWLIDLSSGCSAEAKPSSRSLDRSNRAPSSYDREQCVHLRAAERVPAASWACRPRTPFNPFFDEAETRPQLDECELDLLGSRTLAYMICCCTSFCRCRTEG